MPTSLDSHSSDLLAMASAVVEKECMHVENSSLTKQALLGLLGVRLGSDLHERAADWGLVLRPGPRRRERLKRIAARRMLFIHIPKNGGTSISEALYGLQVGHSSIRYYLAAEAELVKGMPVFAVLRDPEERFLSAYRHARVGQAANKAISPAFRKRYEAFKSIDDALDHVEFATNPYAIDNIFRTQAWYVTDREGDLRVDALLTLDGTEGSALETLLGVRVPHLNQSKKIVADITPNQRARIRKIYREDYALMSASQTVDPFGGFAGKSPALAMEHPRSFVPAPLAEPALVATGA
jgi:hypothetical protein